MPKPFLLWARMTFVADNLPSKFSYENVFQARLPNKRISPISQLFESSHNFIHYICRYKFFQLEYIPTRIIKNIFYFECKITPNVNRVYQSTIFQPIIIPKTNISTSNQGVLRANKWLIFNLIINLKSSDLDLVTLILLNARGNKLMQNKEYSKNENNEVVVLTIC